LIRSTQHAPESSVTGNEYLLRDGIQIVSATNVNGIITFCNPDFIEPAATPSRN